MKSKRISLFMVGSALCSLLAQAQFVNRTIPVVNKELHRSTEDTLSAIIQVDTTKHVYPNALRLQKTRTDSIIKDWKQRYPQVSGATDLAPYDYKLKVPIVYYSTPFHQSIDFYRWKPTSAIDSKPVFNETLDLGNSNFADAQRKIHWVNRSLFNLYVAYPATIVMDEQKIRSSKSLPTDLKTTHHQAADFMAYTSEIEPVRPIDRDLYLIKPNFWTKIGNGYIQFTQTGVSDNWYKGGENTLTLLTGLVLQTNYDDRQKIQWDNRLEWKLGIIKAQTDAIHKYRVNTDLFRLTSKYGYKAIKNWYYTFSVDFKTQLFSNYAKNSNTLSSTFLTPAELNAGLGMDYKYTRDKVMTFSLLLSPLNYTLYAVRSDKVDPTKFNIPAGKKMHSAIGSRIDATLKWKLIENLIWESRLSYNTDYKKSIGEWENTFSFVFNKYISTKLMVHARFDDASSTRGKNGYLQYQEMFSFGLNYNW